MALKLIEDYKGIDAEYWKIITNENDYRTSKTKSIMGLYVDESHSESGVANFLKREVRIFDVVDTSRDGIYTLWKKSNMIPSVDEEGEPLVDKDGEPVMEESNKFASAVDC